MTTLPPEVLSNIAQRRLGAGTQRQTGLQNLATQYNQNIGNLDQYQQDMAQKINNQMSSQGLLNSSIRMDEQGKMQQSVGQKRSWLDTQYAQGKSGIESQYQNALQAISDYQTGAMQDQARSDLAYQQQQAQLQFQQQQAAQQQRNWEVEQWNAAAARNQATQAPAPVNQGPSADDLARFYAEVQRQQNAAIMQWYAALAAQNPTRTQYAGSGNAISGGRGGGATFT